jgi:hypothetical protein
MDNTTEVNNEDQIFNKLIEDLGITEISADTLKSARLGSGLLDQLNSIIEEPSEKNEIH